MTPQIAAILEWTSVAGQYFLLVGLALCLVRKRSVFLVAWIFLLAASVLSLCSTIWTSVIPALFFASWQGYTVPPLQFFTIVSLGLLKLVGIVSVHPRLDKKSWWIVGATSVVLILLLQHVFLYIAASHISKDRLQLANFYSNILHGAVSFAAVWIVFAFARSRVSRTILNHAEA